MTYIYDKNDKNYNLMGGKASAFAKLSVVDVNIPPWFVVSPLAFEESLSKRQQDMLKENNQEKFLRSLKHMSISEKVKKELNCMLEKIGNVSYFAVRSSAVDEDGQENSFAGQFESYLYVKEEELEKYIIKVWQSAFSNRVLEYRKLNKLNSLPTVPAVLIQKMINSEKAGVAFAIDPVEGNLNNLVISAVYGLGTALVGGDISADTYKINKTNGQIEETIVNKEIQQVLVNGKIENKLVNKKQQNISVLNKKQILSIQSLVTKTSEFFGCFQDIEWGIENGQLYLLQSRPITTIQNIIFDSGTLNIWDNSNIAESYPGTTTPLTFSFIRKAYEGSYIQLCRIFKTPEKKIKENNYIFSHMLGFINGRVYYNLLSWYKLIQLLPGYKFNRNFMEQMMGVKESLSEEILPIKENSTGDKIKDFFDLIYACLNFGKQYFILENTIKNFYSRLDNVFINEEDLKNMTLDELCQYYLNLENKLLYSWDAPLINDFFAMIFFGLLRKITNDWEIGKEIEDVNAFYNDLICSSGDIISAQPVKLMKEIAKNIIEDEKFIDILLKEEVNVIEDYIQKEKYFDFQTQIQDYVNKFGDRCLEELKLETETLHDNPITLYRSIGSIAFKLKQNVVLDKDPSIIRKKAEEQIDNIFKTKFIKGKIYKYVVRKTRFLITNRENLRFERTRLFGHIRKLYLEIGQRLTSYNLIENKKDVFYLELEDILGFADGTGTVKNLKELIKLRKEDLTNLPIPDDRFETYSIVNFGNNYKSVTNDDNIISDLKGLGCCSGIVEGVARVITNPKNIQLQKDEILVAERTDPGWIMLFSTAKGVLVEHGSLLSHVAIVVRELGIPSIVSVNNLTKQIKDGDRIRFNGTTGEIEILN